MRPEDSNFRRYSVGSIVSWLSFFVQAVACPGLPGNLTHSTRWLAIVALMDAAPNIVLIPLGGVVADRYDRLRILLISYAMATLQAATWRGSPLQVSSRSACYRPRLPARRNSRIQHPGAIWPFATLHRTPPLILGDRRRRSLYPIRNFRWPRTCRLADPTFRNGNRLCDQRRRIRYLFLLHRAPAARRPATNNLARRATPLHLIFSTACTR